MINPNWIFAGSELTSTADIDAALSQAADGLDSVPEGFFVRVTAHLFRALAQQPSLEQSEDDESMIPPSLDDLSMRLRGASLAIFPPIPQSHKVVDDSELVALMLKTPLWLRGMETGQAVVADIGDEELRTIREIDLLNVVESQRNRAILSVSDGHFELPSGAHTTHFFRLAECLIDVNDLDRIVYWIARDMESQRKKGSEFSELLVLVDNPSTLIIALRLAQLFPRIRYECVHAYPERPGGGSELKDWIDSRLSGRTRLHCIMSVASTGSFVKLLSDAARKLGIATYCSVLYATEKQASLEPYCTLHIDGFHHFNNASTCTLCKDNNSSVFRIDKAQYFLTERKQDAVGLPFSRFKKQRSFLERYGSVGGVLRTHVNDPGWKGGRHRAFSVDVTPLLAVNDFRIEIQQKIKEAAPDLIVVPSHPAAHAIGQYLKSELGMHVVSHPTLRLDTSHEEDCGIAEAISAAKSMMIVDDIAYSAERIQAYVKALRESPEDFKIPDRVTILPLLVLPHDDAKWSTAVRGIESDHDGKVLKIASLYHFALPDWDERCCPWCIESRQLKELSSAFDEDDSDETDSRGTLLDNSDAGLTGLDWMSIRRGFTASTLGTGSPILSVGAIPSQVLFSCASAVQQARHSDDSARLSPDRFPRSSVLGVRVVEDNQNETLLVICLLRCLLRSEIEEKAKAYLRGQILRIGIKNSQEPDRWALQELLLAQLRGMASWIDDKVSRETAYVEAGFQSFLDET